MSDADRASAIEARTVFEYHVRQLGAPRRRAIRGEASDDESLHISFPDSHNWHPVFAFTHAFAGDYEQGFTHNTYRGDHQSLPMWSESGALGILETSFHKGDTFVEFIDWPAAEAAVGQVDPTLIEPDELATHYEAARSLLHTGYLLPLA